MALQKKAGAASAATPATVYNFMDVDNFGAGLGLQNGDWALFFDVRMYHYTKKGGIVASDDMLGVMVTAHSLTAVGDEPKEQFYSMGKNAHKSFMPNENGKGIVPVPGGPSTVIFEGTNWHLLMKSMRDCGMPKEIGASGDLSELDGVWVHTHQVPEPEGRAAFRAASTSEVTDDPKKPKTIPIVSEIKPGGAPWEGGGGMPAGAGTKKAPVAAAKPAGLAKKPLGKTPPPPPPPAATEGIDADLVQAVQECIGTVLTNGSNAKGMKKMAFKVATLAAIKEAYGDEVAVQADTDILSNNDNLNSVLEELGYVLVGLEVKPQ